MQAYLNLVEQDSSAWAWEIDRKPVSVAVNLRLCAKYV